jgi:hypothetical protein
MLTSSSYSFFHCYFHHLPTILPLFSLIVLLEIGLKSDNTTLDYDEHM